MESFDPDSTIKVLRLAENFLSRIEFSDPKIKKEIESLQKNVRGLIHLCMVNQHLAADVGLSLINPRLSKLVDVLILAGWKGMQSRYNQLSKVVCERPTVVDLTAQDVEIDMEED